jgi:hypothetical protein
MKTCISVSYFMRAQAAMLKLGFGLVLVGYAISSHAAQPGVDDFAPGADVLSIPLAYSIIGNDRAPDPGANHNAPDRFGFGKLPNLRPYFNLQKVAAWVASIRWHMTEENNRASFSPRLRVESRGTLISIRPRSHSITVEWHRKLD